MQFVLFGICSFIPIASMGTECSKSDVQEIVEPEPVGVEPEPVVVESEPVESEREESPEPVENTPPPSIHKEPSIASSDEQNKASDFEEFFITFESDSDEVSSLLLFLINFLVKQSESSTF